ncbi:MAG: cation transporter, partial [Flavobacteriaceae bacterium CG02_land_8_20_14_3_00_34_13]
EKLPEIKKALKEELEEHNIKHSTLEFEFESENCKDTKI